MAKKNLPPNYHRDWQRNKAMLDPDWYEQRKASRTDLRRTKKSFWVSKFGGKCNKCNGEFPDYVFEFHHLNPDEKEKTPAQLFMLSDDNIEKELSKCILVCSNCHKIIHHEDGYKAHEKRKKYG
jgi:hypothetical protein